MQQLHVDVPHKWWKDHAISQTTHSHILPDLSCPMHGNVCRSYILHLILIWMRIKLFLYLEGMKHWHFLQMLWTYCWYIPLLIVVVFWELRETDIGIMQEIGVSAEFQLSSHLMIEGGTDYSSLAYICYIHLKHLDGSLQQTLAQKHSNKCGTSYCCHEYISVPGLSGLCCHQCNDICLTLWNRSQKT